MKSEWKKYTFDDVCTRIYSGGTPSTKKPEYWNGTINWLSSGETGKRYIYKTERKISELGVEKSSTQKAYFGNTVVASAGQGHTRGQASFLMIDTFVNQSVIVFDANTEIIDSKYLYFNIDSRYDELRQLSDGTSTRGGLSGWIVKRMEIDLPPLETQKQIVSILSAIDDKIELNNRINENLEKQAQAIFEDLFPNCMANGIAISSIIEVRDGTHDSPKAQISGHYLITSKHLKPYSVNKNDANHISISDYSKINERSKVEYGDILISMIGTVGLISYVSDENVDYAIKNVGLFRTSQKKELRFYLLNYLKSVEVTNYIEQHLAGSTQKYISLTELRNLPVYLPSNKELNIYNQLVIPIYNQIITINKENQLLSELRDTLLPKLMNGEIDVSTIKI